MSKATLLLKEMAEGRPSAAEELFPLVYEQLRALAGAFFREERADHSLQPTALVHEAYVRMVESSADTPRTRVHFHALAARVMRHVLVDHARARNADKRGGGDDRARITLSDVELASREQEFDFEAIHNALTELAKLNERTARVVELRFFGSLTLEEVAAVLGISLSSAEREWRFARAWLLEELAGKDGRA
jgi:RNA polymerase sigma factor (TIGR02999 family)